MFCQPLLHLGVRMTVYNPKQFAISLGNQPLTKLNELAGLAAGVQHEPYRSPFLTLAI